MKASTSVTLADDKASISWRTAASDCSSARRKLQSFSESQNARTIKIEEQAIAMILGELIRLRTKSDNESLNTAKSFRKNRSIRLINCLND
jgi:hypothetical protein